MKILPSLALVVVAGPVLLCATSAQARGRKVVLRPASGTTLSRPLPLSGGVRRIANAQLLPDTTAHAVDLQGDSLTIGLGDVVLLPFSSVTRIITEDDEIARAYFQNGSPVLQGVAVGSTTVEIYQASNSPRVLTISVAAKSTLPPAVPLPTPEPTPSPFGNNTIEVPAPTPSPQIGDPLPPATGTDIAPLPDPSSTNVIQPSRSSLTVALRAIATPGNPGQATFTISYANRGDNPARGAIVRFALDERVSYVTGSASNAGQYDPAQRDVVWNIGDVPAGFTGGQLALRVEPIERASFSFQSQATIEDASSAGPIGSAQVTYWTTTTPLLTVFAMPDRFLASSAGAKLVDVRGDESQSAVDRLQYLGVVNGREPGRYYPKQATQRAEYAVMTLNGLNLRDLRDVTQIKFVLSRRSTVSVAIQNAAGKRIADLVRQTAFDAGEHTVAWNGKSAAGFVTPGRYTYVCTARDAKGETTTLRGNLQLVSNSPLELEGLPSFVDVSASDWFARYLAVGEKQGLVFGYQNKFRPRDPISRVEATAIVVRALGLSDVAKEWADKDVGFLDYTEIPAWARGSVNVATTIAKTGNGRPIMRGTPQNKFDPNSALRRDQAAIIVQRLIDRETTRRINVSGSIAPGAAVSINSRPISADGTGSFSFPLDVTTSAPTTVAVWDTRGNNF
ncbi:hypothetical protein IAD21_02919 [Abditibacteriota bacterium]|nr:hypothetical protein IAD21_02919 [Abditibacteriota bacterium]